MRPKPSRRSLSMANPAEGATVAHTEAPGGGHEAEPNAFGLTPPWFIAAAMIVVIAILIWKRVPAAIGKALDKKIAQIREQLDEASALRKEAEERRRKYGSKAASADAEAAAMIERAKGEAQAIVAKAEVDAKSLVERRKAMAGAKIGGKKRGAVAELRSPAARAATAAAAKLIADRNDAKSDQALVDQAISQLTK